jgi:type IV pilus assembly protein PilC
MQISHFVTAYPYLLFLVIITIFTVFTLLLKSKQGRYLADRLYLGIPLIKQNLNLRFTQAMSILLSSGQTVTTAIPACANVLDNTHAKRDIMQAAAGVNEGRPLWEALTRVRFIDPMLAGMVRVGEETGRLPQVMDKCRHYFTQSHRQSMQKTAKLVEPLITLVLGILLGLVMLAIILPTFALTDII